MPHRKVSSSNKVSQGKMPLGWELFKKTAFLKEIGKYFLDKPWKRMEFRSYVKISLQLCWFRCILALADYDCLFNVFFG